MSAICKLSLSWRLLLLLHVAACSLIELPICATSCGPNAECSRSGICVCLPGYEQTISEENGLPYCKALCETPCQEYSTCVAPNECECVAGYEEKRSAGDTSFSVFSVGAAAVAACVPKCQRGCTHGSCVAPDECVCAAGYVKSVTADVEVCTLLLMTTTKRTTQSTEVSNTILATQSSSGSSSGTSERSMESSESYYNNIVALLYPSAVDAAHNKKEQVKDMEEDRETMAHVAPVPRKQPKQPHELPRNEVPLAELTPLEVLKTTEQTLQQLQCPDNQVYYKGGCRSTLKNNCVPDQCAPHGYCDERDECVCEPGYELYVSKVNEQTRCLWDGTAAAVVPERATVFDYFWYIGWASMAVALLLFVVFICREGKKK